jgi:GNAT superfamily N-acetyltransferase
MLSRSIDLEEIRRMEERGFRAWPALETLDVAGWRLRFSGGYTKRANSINALGDISEFSEETASSLEKPYRERGLGSVWRLTPLAPPAADAFLASRGYRAIERSLVQRRPLPLGLTADRQVEILPQPSPAWIEAFAQHSPVRLEHRPVMQRMLSAIAAPVGFAFVVEDGRPMAMAIGVVDGDHMGLFDVLVMPHARRRGLARRVTESLYAWAWQHGARFAWLQVVATNDAALPLYAAQGFRTLYEYEYRIPPSS